MTGFTKKESAEISELSMRAVQYFTERGLVEPEVDPGEGKGSTRLYSRKNLLELSIIRAMTMYGMSFHVIKRLMSLLKNITTKWDQIASPAYLIFYPEREELKLELHTEKITSAMFDKYDLKKSCLIIEVGKIVRKLSLIIVIEENLHLGDRFEAEVTKGGGV